MGAPQPSARTPQFLVAIAFATLLGLLILGGALSYRAFRATRQSQNWVEHSYQAIAALNSILLDLNSAESAHTGFVLTKDKELLTSYEESVKALRGELLKVRELASDTPSQQQRLQRLEPLLQERMSFLEETAKAVRSGSGFVLEDAEATLQGRDVLKRVGALIAAMEQDEGRVLALRALAEDKAAKHAALTLLSANCALAVLVLMIGALLLHEVTRRRRIEDALREHEFRLRLAVATADLGTYERDLSTNEVILNSVCRNIFGLPAGPAPSDIATRSVHPDDRERVYSEAAQSFDPELRTVSGGEFRILRPDGSICWVAGKGRVLFDDTVTPPKAQKFLGVLLDITDRKHAEEALRESEQRFRLFMDNSPTLAWVKDQDGRYVYMNRSFEKQFGTILAECLGKTDDELWPPDVAARFRANDHTVLSTWMPTAFTEETTSDDGTTTYWLNHKFPFRDATAKNFIASIGLDITPRKQAEAAMQAAREELARANIELELNVRERTTRLRETVEELEGLSYSLVHDLRAPLRAMQTYATVLEEECSHILDPKKLDYLRRIRVATNRMDQLITDSLNYSRVVREHLPMTPVNVGKLLRGLVESYPNLQPPEAHISIEIPDLLVQGNEAALTQVFSNLLGNAVKFVAPGVKPRIRVWAERKNHHALVWVQDNGIGIPRDAHFKIFGMFQRMHRVDEYPGTGIGLAIVQKSLERIGGRIRLDSEPGKGSRFCVELQLADQRQEAELVGETL